MTYLIGIIPGAIAGIFYAWWGTKLVKPNENYKWSLWASLYYKVMGFIIMPFIIGPLATYFYSFIYGNKGINGFLKYAYSWIFCSIIGIIGARYYWKDKKLWRLYLIGLFVFIFAFGLLVPLLYYLING